MRQDHVGPPVRAGGLAQLLRSGRPASLARLDRAGHRLRPLKGLVVIDEIQRRPDLSRCCACWPTASRCPRVPDSRQCLARSAEAIFRDARRPSGNRPAGRLSTGRPGRGRRARHWLRGGFPLAYTARTEADSLVWRRQFLQTFLERDLPQLGITIPAIALRRFWNMVAHYHGQIWNAAELARALAVNESTVRRYLDLLTGRVHGPATAAVVREPRQTAGQGPQGLCARQRPAARAARHRQPARPGTPSQSRRFVGRLCRRGSPQGVRPDEAYFWATHQGAEIDLCCSRAAAASASSASAPTRPTLTPSMRIALADLKLDELAVVYPGEKRYALAKKVEVVPLAQLVNAK